jgi:hypothetical protein
VVIYVVGQSKHLLSFARTHNETQRFPRTKKIPHLGNERIQVMKRYKSANEFISFPLSFLFGSFFNIAIGATFVRMTLAPDYLGYYMQMK